MMASQNDIVGDDFTDMPIIDLETFLNAGEDISPEA